MKYLLQLTLVFILGISNANSQPWIDTNDVWLRSDIEVLADVGIIKIPITTYPLMWSGIIKNLDNTEIEKVAPEHKDLFWRVKKAAKQATRKEVKQELAISAASKNLHYRSYGDSNREKAQISAKKYGMSKNYAWNLQVTRVANPNDGDKTRYDGSYLAGVFGNWIVSVGATEKWWGPSWDSADLLSNNARPPIGISVSRNYSDYIDIDLLRHLGPWSITGFISQLDDEREVDNSYFSGLSISFKPHQSLETSIRTTTLSGGDNKIDTIEVKNEKYSSFDFRWRLPFRQTIFKSPVSVYGSYTSQLDSEKKHSKQLGATTRFSILDSQWKVYVENSQTGFYKRDFLSDQENALRKYLYQGRNFGSGYAPNSKVTTLGFISQISRYSSVSLKFQSIEQSKNNLASLNESPKDLHCQSCKFERAEVKWSYNTSRNSNIVLDMSYSSEPTFQLNNQSVKNDKRKVGLTWTYRLN